jgi:CRP-like cAMP-binding protein
MIDMRLLKEQRFFSDLSDEELGVLAGIAHKKAFKLGERAFKASEAGRSLYLIRSGEVKVCLEAPDGEVFTLTILKDGDIFGQMSFVDAALRSATVIAISDVETLSIEGSDFDKIADHHPRMVFKVMRGIVHHAHSIVRGMNSRYIEMMNYMWGRKRYC